MKRIKNVFNTIRALSTASQSPKSSYFFKPGDFPLIHTNLGQLVNKAADESGDVPAFVSYHQGVQKTFSEFKSLVDKLASGLLSLGLQKGDRVAICAYNNYEWPIVEYAAAKAGLILVTINPAYREEELEYCLKMVGCRALFTSESFKTQNYYEMLCSFLPELHTNKTGMLQTKRLPNLQSVILLSEKARSGTLTFNDLINAGDSRSEKLLGTIESQVQFDDPVNIQFTSGTTGSPKAAILSHHNIVNNANIAGRRFGYPKRGNFIACCQVPLYHCFGSVLGTVGALVFQHTCVFPVEGFDAVQSLKAIQDMKCTAVYGTPTMYVDLLNKYKEGNYDISSLTQVVYGGAACPESVLKDIHENLKISHIHAAYGLTETSPAVSGNGKHEDVKTTIFPAYMPPFEYAEIKVIDKDGFLVDIGQQGELCIRGHYIFAGYWNQPEKTAEAIDKHNWFHSGDLVTMREDGYIKIIGRIKDMVNRGGENVYPLEVENFLHKHPAILEAHVCGVPDSRLGEELCAWIRVRNGENLSEVDVKNYCKGKISHYKVPRYIMFVQEYPKTVSGKVQKYKMREISIEKLKHWSMIS